MCVHAAKDGKKTHTTLRYIYKYFKSIQSFQKQFFLFVFLSAVRSKIILFNHDSALTLNLFFLKQKAVYAFFGDLSNDSRI